MPPAAARAGGADGLVKVARGAWACAGKELVKGNLFTLQLCRLPPAEVYSCRVPLSLRPLGHTRILAVLTAGIAASGALFSGGAAAALHGHDGRRAAHGRSTAYTPPRIKHVWTIVLENKSYEASFTGLNQNSYLWKTLPTYGLLQRQYYGTGHYSQDNYISMIGGQAPAPDTQAD